MLLTIKHPNNDLPKVSISDDATLSDLKEEINRLFKISPLQQKLICCGRILPEGKLMDSGVKDGSLLYLVTVLRGG